MLERRRILGGGNAEHIVPFIEKRRAARSYI
jgi:hypothetical protein